MLRFLRRPRFLSAAVAMLALIGSLDAQQLAVTISPNPAPVGSTITVTARDTSGLGLYTPNSCLIGGIRQGSQSGPNVYLSGCTFLCVAIPPCGSPSPRTAT